jgi:hypothetical protein
MYGLSCGTLQIEQPRDRQGQRRRFVGRERNSPIDEICEGQVGHEPER